MKSLSLILAVLGLGVVPAIPVTHAQQIETFSWSERLGKTVEDLSSALGESVNCSATPLEFRLHLDRQVNDETFHDWEHPNSRPSGNRAILLPKSGFSSKWIVSFGCDFPPAATIEGLAVNTNPCKLSVFDLVNTDDRCDYRKAVIFAVGVGYGHCRDLECELTQTELDNSAMTLYGTERVMVPFIGSDSIPTAEQSALFDAVMSEHFGSVPLRNSFFRSSDCFTAALYEYEYRCFVAAEHLGNGVLHTLTFAQVLQSEGGNAPLDLMVGQRFLDTALQASSFRTFIQEANEIVTVSMKDAESLRARRQQQHKKIGSFQ